jgi:methyl-accepting chemotaxis protein
VFLLYRPVCVELGLSLLAGMVYAVSIRLDLNKTCLVNSMSENQELQVKELSEGPQDGYSRLSEVFEASARRWELIIYPSLVMFIVLAAYGFYLIFNLQRDVHQLAISVDTNMTSLAGNMQIVSENMQQMTNSVRVMTTNLDSIDRQVANLEPIRMNMNSMDHAVRSMSRATHSINHATQGMNHSIRPMSFMNNFLPW